MKTFGMIATVVLVLVGLFFAGVGISALAQNMAYIDALKQVFGIAKKATEDPEQTQAVVSAAKTILRI